MLDSSLKNLFSFQIIRIKYIFQNNIQMEPSTSTQTSKDTGYMMDISFESSEESSFDLGIMDQSNDSVSEDSTPTTSDATKKRFIWSVEHEFDSIEEAKKIIKTEGFAQFDFKYLNCGAKFYYRCNEIRT